ncbi:metal cation symporter ZIP8 [Lepisosteus oculatus]|uniref:metal cation symporter ZIP8 n=1 Tax=Lepisosteus oculatus TaxID=7918 RepID=UPI0035F52E18
MFNTSSYRIVAFIVRSLFLIATLHILTSKATVIYKRKSFLEDIFGYYGENETFSSGKLESLLYRVGSRRPQDNVGELEALHNSQCLSSGDILSLHELNNQSRLTMSDFEKICPAILQQAVVRPCLLSTQEPEPSVPHKPVSYHVWGYGVLAVTIINMASLLGLILVPFTKKPYFPKLLTYFTGLAIGTLYSNAVLQLIPEALGFDPKKDNYVLNAVGIFGGFYVLFFTEKILQFALKPEHKQGHSHFNTSEEESNQSNANKMGTNSVTNGELTHKTEIITVTSFSCSEEPSIGTAAQTDQDIQVSRGYCRWLSGPRIRNIKTVAWMITLSDALHNFIDGLAIGASFTVSVINGVSTSIAIVCEEFPHELGDFVILLSAGMSIPQALFFNLLSACSCYIGLILGIVVGTNFSPNVIFAFAGGMFLYIALADMFLEMNNIQGDHERNTRSKIIFFTIQNLGLLTGFSVILLITMFAGNIKLE